MTQLKNLKENKITAFFFYSLHNIPPKRKDMEQKKRKADCIQRFVSTGPPFLANYILLPMWQIKNVGYHVDNYERNSFSRLLS